MPTVTTIDRVFAIAPELRAAFPPQKDTVTIIADNEETKLTIDDETYEVDGTDKTKEEIASELASEINDAQASVVTAVADGATITLTATTVGVGYTVTAGENCTVESEEGNPEVVAIILEDVGNLSRDAFGTRYEEAQRYLAAHLLTLAAQQSAMSPLGAVTSQSVGGVSISFGSPRGGTNRLDSTKYGQRYNDLLRSSVPRLGVY